MNERNDDTTETTETNHHTNDPDPDHYPPEDEITSRLTKAPAGGKSTAGQKWYGRHEWSRYEVAVHYRVEPDEERLRMTTLHYVCEDVTERYVTMKPLTQPNSPYDPTRHVEETGDTVPVEDYVESHHNHAPGLAIWSAVETYREYCGVCGESVEPDERETDDLGARPVCPFCEGRL